MALPKERVLDYSTRYRLTETGAEIDYTVSTNGPHPVTVELYDGTTRVAESSGTTGTLVVKNAKLWNVHAAHLYDLVIRIHEGSAVVDEYLTGSASAPLRSGTGVSCSTAARSICGALAGTRMPTSGAVGSTCPPSSGILS